jgi:hypothetical protein
MAPMGLKLLYANGRSATGVILDELDVPHVVTYSVRDRA